MIEISCPERCLTNHTWRCVRGICIWHWVMWFSGYSGSTGWMVRNHLKIFKISLRSLSTVIILQFPQSAELAADWYEQAAGQVSLLCLPSERFPVGVTINNRRGNVPGLGWKDCARPKNNTSTFLVCFMRCGESCESNLLDWMTDDSVLPHLWMSALSLWM